MTAENCERHDNLGVGREGQGVRMFPDGASGFFVDIATREQPQGSWTRLAFGRTQYEQAIPIIAATYHAEDDKIITTRMKLSVEEATIFNEEFNRSLHSYGSALSQLRMDGSEIVEEFRMLIKEFLPRPVKKIVYIPSDNRTHTQDLNMGHPRAYSARRI
ncbi:MAG TPA: hypothetical protein VG965_03435 [Patescibacteria group bacterium]|nr:hypothetical protein [Patescibacteria group bacterium]